MKNRSLWLIFAATLFISACGGGGGGSAASAPSTLGGTAAVGYPIVNGTIQLRCAGGSSLSGTTDSAGLWQVSISGQTLPCAVELNGGTINNVANTTSYHSIATSWGTVNITPLTDLIVANLAAQDPGAWFAGLTGATLTPITSTSVNNARTNLSNALSGLAPLSTVDPVATPFTATSGDTGDDMLAALKTAMTNTGVSYTTLLGYSYTPVFRTSVATLNAALPAAYAGMTSGILPTITGMSPNTGAAGTTVTITGTNFSTTPANNTVKFNGTQATVTAATATSITVTVPSGATTGTVTVTKFGGSASSAGSFTVTGSGLSINPTSLTFAQQTPGTTSAVQTVTLSNTGTATVSNLTILFSFPSNFVQTTTCGNSLAIGASCTIAVSFSPTAYTANGAASTRSQLMTIKTANSTSNVSLNGAVAALPKPALLVTPASLTFSQAVSTLSADQASSAAQMVTLTNTGNAPLNIYCIETPPIGGSSNCYSFHSGELTLPRDYAQTNTCTLQNLVYPPTDSDVPPDFLARANLAVGASCTISVKFTPQLTGARNGVLIIDTNAENSPSLLVPLNGNSAGGSAPTVTGFSPTSGAASTTVTVTGTNFSTTPANNTCWFNGTLATVTAATATSLTVTVPSGATTGTIAVTTAGGTATSAASFTVSAGGSTGGGTSGGVVLLSCNYATAKFCQDYYIPGGTCANTVAQQVASCAPPTVGTCTVSNANGVAFKTYYYTGCTLSTAQSACSLYGGVWQ